MIERIATRHIDKLHCFKSLWQHTERDSRSIKMDIGEKSYELEYVLEKNDTGNDVSFKFRIWRLVLWDILRFLHLDLLGVLRTLGFYINFRQLAINGHSPRYVRGAR